MTPTKFKFVPCQLTTSLAELTAAYNNLLKENERRYQGYSPETQLTDTRDAVRRYEGQPEVLRAKLEEIDYRRFTADLSCTVYFLELDAARSRLMTALEAVVKWVDDRCAGGALMTVAQIDCMVAFELSSMVFDRLQEADKRRPGIALSADGVATAYTTWRRQVV